jgi:hypothetical protein
LPEDTEQTHENPVRAADLRDFDFKYAGTKQESEHVFPRLRRGVNEVVALLRGYAGLISS